MCNKLKSAKNLVYKNWEYDRKPEETTLVGICRGCNATMKKLDVDSVLYFLEMRGER
jgi:hypothetical protein